MGWNHQLEDDAQLGELFNCFNGNPRGFPQAKFQQKHWYFFKSKGIATFSKPNSSQNIPLSLSMFFLLFGRWWLLLLFFFSPGVGPSRLVVLPIHHDFFRLTRHLEAHTSVGHATGRIYASWSGKTMHHRVARRVFSPLKCWSNPRESMGRLYIYLHENHKFMVECG